MEVTNNHAVLTSMIVDQSEEIQLNSWHPIDTISKSFVVLIFSTFRIHRFSVCFYMLHDHLINWQIALLVHLRVITNNYLKQKKNAYHNDIYTIDKKDIISLAKCHYHSFQ